MAVPNNRSDDALLKNLVPLNTLSEEQLGQLLSRIVVEKAKKGEYLFREGDTDHQNVYLLAGSVSLLSGQREMDMVSSGTQTARFALAHQLPRKHSAKAKSAVSYVRIDSRMLSDLLARSHSASYEVTEASSSGKSDWMSLLLQSPVFQQIPPANLQRVMMRMQEITVSADDVIIQQGDEGDYFYLISKGVCRVTRQPSADHPPVELAQLKAGQGFGEEALISDTPRSSTVIMLTEGHLVRLSKKDFVELVKQPVSHVIDYSQACKMAADNALWIDVRIPEDYEAGHIAGAINLPFFSIRFQASSLASDRTYLIYGREAGQSATAAYLLVERGYEVMVVNEGWKELTSLVEVEASEVTLPVDNVIDFNRDVAMPGEKNAQQNEAIVDAPGSGLQQEKTVTKHNYEEKLNQFQTEAKLLKQGLGVAKRKLAQQEQTAKEAQESLRHKVDQLQNSLATANEKAHNYKEILANECKLKEQVRHLQEELKIALANAEQAIQQQSQLSKQLQTSEGNYKQKQNELQGEVEQLQQKFAASQANLQEQEQQASKMEKIHVESEVSLNEKLTEAQEQIKSLEVELKSAKTAAADNQEQLFRLNSKLELADQTTHEQAVALDQQQKVNGELSQKIQQTTTDAEALRQKLEQMGQEFTDSENQHQQSITSLQQQLTASQAEAHANQEVLKESKVELNELNEKRIELEALFEQEHQTVKFLKRSLATAEDAVEISDKAGSKYRDELDKINQTLATLNHEKAQLKDEKIALEQRLSAAEKNLEEQLHASNEMDQTQQESIERMKSELVQARNEVEQVRADKIAQEKKQQAEINTLQKSKIESEAQFKLVQNTLIDKEKAFVSATAEHKHTLEQLEIELSTTRNRLEKSVLAQAETQAVEQTLQDAREEITRLKQNITGLREVQLEMESQLSNDAEEEILQLREALDTEERKRHAAEELAKQAAVLRREREVQESAVEILGEDLENLGRENEQLVTEKGDLTKQIKELREQSTELKTENQHLQTEISSLRGQESNSNKADDLLIQLETLHSTADKVKQERDEARTESTRMKREVRELRSVIETYVGQIQHATSIDASDELTALRSELDMVRRQASEDLEQMRNQLADMHATTGNQQSRDASDAASLQAFRQEIDSNQKALSDKEHLLRLSQTQCRTLEDEIEDRDKEIDQLRRKLELLIRKTGGLDDLSESLSTEILTNTQQLFTDSQRISKRLDKDSGTSGRKNLGRLFRNR